MSNFSIPEQFIIHGHTIKVVQEETNNPEENRFGYYDSVKEEIVIFKQVYSNGTPVTLTEIQLLASFFHELMHSFQWHIKGDTNEQEAQSYSGLLVEFFKTKYDGDL